VVTGLRVLRLLITHFLVAALAVCGTLLWVYTRPKATPPLLTGFQPSGFMDSGEFAKRLASRFPVGSPERDLIEDLAENRFQIDVADPPSRAATYDSVRQSGFDVCRRTATVRWTTDDTRRLSAITGTYVVTCL